MIYFVGAGPGNVELITVKGANLLSKADVVIYAGSLVNKELLTLVDSKAEIYDSSSLTLDEVLKIMVEAEEKQKMVVRLHTGDPSLYGAIQEQLDYLHSLGIATEVVPGVSSAFAAAASIQRELTLPEVSQTVILTRLSGRTLVPEKEKLAKLAYHQATMAIFLSVHQIEEVVAQLIEGGYPKTTPVAVIEKASWPEEKIIKGDLQDIAKKVKEAGIFKTAMILVGEALSSTGYEPSKLYHPEFSHGFRRAKN